MTAPAAARSEGLASLAWPASRAAEAVAALAATAGLAVRRGVLPAPPDGACASPDGVALWIEHASAHVGIDAEPVGAFYPDLEALARGAPPALLALGPDLLLAVAAVDRSTARVIAPDGAAHAVPFADLWARLVSGIPDADDAGLDELLTRARVPGRRRARARESLRRTRLSAQWVEGWWMLRPRPSAALREHAAHGRLGRRLVAIVAAHALLSGLGLVGWWLIGAGALDGRLDRGWLVAWALLLVTQVATHVLVSRAESLLAVDVGGLLKQRLLAGALALSPERVRRRGAGQLLGTVLESEAIEELALSGGFTSVVSLVELVAAAVVLACGAAARVELSLLALWIVLTGALVLRYWRARRDWTDERIEMTHALVEKMVGHRTRLAQERPSSRHASEDEAAARCLATSERMDRRAAKLAAVVPQGWLVVGIAALGPTFAAAGASVPDVAVSVGGVILAYRALRKLVLGLTSLSGAHLAWRRVQPLLEDTPVDVDADPRLVPGVALEAGRAPILDAREVSFAYPRRAEPVLRVCDLALRSGDRVLLEGASGGGKSTLSALLAGLREPTAGVLLLGGLDRRSLGLAAWRRRVALAPQFHENHVLTGTLAFNLLMGRRWPPRAEDLAEAESLCLELGLGPLLARMPSGIEQMVGETGWQLSQGEKSRLYLARALLQNADVLVLDESFAALDPHTTRAAFACVLRRAKTLLVVAHP
ncbi:MAG: ABC transporter ATP-binding protein [Labilithrix sp.]|nr:ABC transporter ATP-binding protein [Labilithrix sp.]MBX3211641.1 ABC transporter ATP-binding protein [Labilithrix sp.]